MRIPIVVVVAFDKISLFHLSVPCLVFGEDRTAIGLPRIEFRLCAAEPGRLLQTTGGAGLVAPYGLEKLRDADVVIVPSWLGPDVEVPKDLTAAIADAYSGGALVVGLCRGTFVLAAAGVLNGQRATTHWTLTQQLATSYPDITVEPDVIYVDSGRVVTSALGPSHRASASPSRGTGTIHRTRRFVHSERRVALQSHQACPCRFIVHAFARRCRRRLWADTADLHTALPESNRY
jgi:putative intracellular protease/amidase